VQSVFCGLLIVLGMGIASDGTRTYIVYTAILGLLGMVVTFASFLMVMTIMYRWVNEQDQERKDPPTLATDKHWIYPYYQSNNGKEWQLGKPYQASKAPGDSLGKIDKLHGKV
jgi:hypothetical protein